MIFLTFVKTVCRRYYQDSIFCVRISHEENWKTFANRSREIFLSFARHPGRESCRSFKATVVSLHPRDVKNDIKFKSSLNKKSFPEARDRIIRSSENSKVKYPRRRPARFSIINFNVVPDKKRETPRQRREEGGAGGEVGDDAILSDDLFREDAR